MSNRVDEALTQWLECDMSPSAVGRLVDHPSFTQAARALNRVKVEAALHPVMSLFSKDAGHYVAAAMCFSLHGNGGITLPRLKAASATSRLMSAGRARALLGYWVHVGFLSVESHRQGRDAARFIPTERFVDAWCGRMRSGLASAAQLEASVDAVLTMMHDRRILVSYSQVRGETVLAGLARAEGHESSFARIFNHRVGGGRALALLLSRDAHGASLASGPIAFSVQEISEHCKISRIQARRLFDAAEAEGLIGIKDGALTFSEAARRHITYATAFEFASMLRSAAVTLKAFSAPVLAAE